MNRNCLSNKWLVIATLVLAISCTSTIASLLMSENPQEDMVFLMGKWFYKNGKPNLPADATDPEWFEQCMDHFNSSGCLTKWRQRYWVREDYYQPGGPIFFQFGGEGPADGYIDAFYWHNYARQYNAMLIVLEHRFYGESWPSRDSSMEVLQLLTSQQALADAAYFIDRFTESRNLNDSKWVAFGGSYAGNLAAWMKQKYPGHVKTAVASSGPLLAVYDFPGYMETVSDVVKEIDEDCFDKVYNAYNCMESLVNGSNCDNYSETSEIIPALRQCQSIDFGDALDRESFFLDISMGPWADNWPSRGVIRNCDIIKEITETDKIKLYGDFLVEMGYGGNCKVKLRSNPKIGQVTNEEEFFRFIHSEEGKKAGAAGWFWQTCYEFGYYMSSDPKNGLFGHNTWSGLPYGSWCPRDYGDMFTREYVEDRIALTNNFYKARSIDSKCVIFVNGAWDPWHTLGINNQSETTPDNTVVHIPRAEHADDMYNPKSEEIAQAQQFIQAQIGLYLDDPKC